MTDRLVEPLLAGVYAGHAREISAEQAVPALAAAAHEGRPLLDVARAAAEAAAHGPLAGRPVFASLVGGLGTLPEVLERELVAAGVRVRTGAVARGLRRDGDGLGRVDRAHDRRRRGALRRRRGRRPRGAGLAPAA